MYAPDELVGPFENRTQIRKYIELYHLQDPSNYLLKSRNNNYFYCHVEECNFRICVLRRKGHRFFLKFNGAHQHDRQYPVHHQAKLDIMKKVIAHHLLEDGNINPRMLYMRMVQDMDDEERKDEDLQLKLQRLIYRLRSKAKKGTLIVDDESELDPLPLDVGSNPKIQENNIGGGRPIENKDVDPNLFGDQPTLEPTPPKPIVTKKKSTGRGRGRPRKYPRPEEIAAEVARMKEEDSKALSPPSAISRPPTGKEASEAVRIARLLEDENTEHETSLQVLRHAAERQEYADLDEHETDKNMLTKWTSSLKTRLFEKK